MIEIDKNDFLYNSLVKLGAEDVDEKYVELASVGISNQVDLKRYLISKYSKGFDEEIDEEALNEVADYFKDIKKAKKFRQKELNSALKLYVETKDKDTFEKIFNSKAEDALMVALLYKNKYKEIDILDIVQVCNMGLMKAIEKFDIKSKLSFDCYIDFWIDEEIEKTFTKENK